VKNVNILEYLNQVAVTQDQFLSVAVKPQFQIDENHMAVQNANTSIMLGCIRDRYTANLLLYDTRNHITLRKYLESVQFTGESFRQLLLQLIEGVDALAKLKLFQTNILYSLDRIYVDVVNKRLKLCCVPVRTTLTINDAMQAFAELLREMVQTVRIPDGHMLFGLIFAHLSAQRFNVVNFYRDIMDYEDVTQKRSYRAISRVMLCFFITAFVLALAVLGVPLWGLLSKTYAITQFIDMNTIYFEALLFLAGAIVASLICIPLRETRKRRRKKNKALPQAARKTKSKQGAQAPSAPVPAPAPAPAPAPTPVIPAAAPVGGAPQAAAVAVLVDEKGGDIPITTAEFIIGREADFASLCIDQPSVSANHASVLQQNGQFYLRDNGSRNGTALNGKELAPEERVLLKDGDDVVFAEVRYTFTLRYH